MQDQIPPLFEFFQPPTHGPRETGKRSLPELVAQRSTPGILIFNVSNKLIYINSEAREVLQTLGPHADGDGQNDSESPAIPETVTNLCNQLKLTVLSYKTRRGQKEPKQTPSVLALASNKIDTYTFRGLFLSNNHRGRGEDAYILVLVERASPSKKLDLQKALQAYKLSKREMDVVELLILGHKNKEIADKLFVCVYTIEDHIKKIMKKMNAPNRTSIISKVLLP